MDDPVTPAPIPNTSSAGDSEGAAQEVNSAVEFAHLSLQGAVQLARKAADNAIELPEQAIDALEAGLERVKDEIARLRHVISFNEKAQVGAEATARTQATLETTTTPEIGAEAPERSPNT